MEDVGREVDETKNVESRRGGCEGGNHGEGRESGARRIARRYKYPSRRNAAPDDGAIPLGYIRAV